jgi:hypothetical protein
MCYIDELGEFDLKYVGDIGGYLLIAIGIFILLFS